MVSKRNGRQMRYVIYFGSRESWLCLAEALHDYIEWNKKYYNGNWPKSSHWRSLLLKKLNNLFRICLSSRVERREPKIVFSVFIGSISQHCRGQEVCKKKNPIYEVLLFE